MRLRSIFLIFLANLFVFATSNAQNQQTSPDDYHAQLSALYVPVFQECVAYVSQLSHDEQPKKLDEARLAILESFKPVLAGVTRLKPIADDKQDYRGQVLEAVTVMQQTFAYDYKEISTLYVKRDVSPELAQRYYDLQMVCERKLINAWQQIEDVRVPFCTRFELTTNGEKDWSKASEVLNAISEANTYYRSVFSVYATVGVTVEALNAAIDAENHVAFEKARATLEQGCPAAVAEIDGLGAYNGDDYFRETCKGYLQYFLSASGAPFIKLKEMMKSKTRLSPADEKSYLKLIADHDKRQLSLNANILKASAAFRAKQIPYYVLAKK